MKKIFPLLLILLLNLFSKAENRQHQVDSLLKALETSKDTSRANILNELGRTYLNQGKYPQAIESLLGSLKLYENSGNQLGALICRSRLADVYCNEQDFKTALSYMLNAKKGIEDGIIYDQLGMIYSYQGNLNKSLALFMQALRFYSDKSDNKIVARILNDIGSIHESEGKSDSAFIYYKKSLNISEEENDKTNMIIALASMGDIYFSQKEYIKALQYENKSLVLTKETSNPYSQRETERMLSKIYDALNIPLKSLEHYKKYIAIKDSLINGENIKQIAHIEDNFKFEKEKEFARIGQDKKDAITAQEKQRQKIIIYSVSMVLFLMLLLVIFIFRGYRQKKKANIIISEQKKIVYEQKEEILDSIRYASRIYNAILPPTDFINEILPEHLIYFAPRDIIGGDFYFVDKNINEGKIFWASLDQTGHSTNGAMLGMLSMNILTGIIKEGEMIPSKILDKLNERFNASLHKIDDNSVRDGLDLTFCSLDKKTMELNFSGANNPLWVINKGILTEYKTDKMAIGQWDKKQSYTNHTIQLEKNSIIYSFSDGICDLHSEDNKKFMKKRLRELLLSIQEKTMMEQKEIISKSLKSWQGNAQQVDDMLLIAVRV